MKDSNEHNALLTPTDHSTGSSSEFFQNATAQTDALIGTIFDGKYRIEKKIGVGGMGVVYYATHIYIERPVAIKFLLRDLCNDTEATERFKLEARAAGRIQHPNVTSILDFGITDDLLYLVMEYLEGQTLRQKLRDYGPLSLTETIKIISQVCDALEAAHKSSVIHRDLKPENIFLQNVHGVEKIKVLDFGIAKILRNTNSLELTTDMLVGTPQYMSPEQCQSAPLTPASDIYSLGIILFEMLSSQLPFNGDTPVAVAFKHLRATPPSLTKLESSVPVSVEDVIMKALSKRPELRQSSASMLMEELKKCVVPQERVAKHLDEKLLPIQNTKVCSNINCRSGFASEQATRCPSCQLLFKDTVIRHRYRIDKMIGKGGFGTTYLVQDEDCFNEPRILKEFTPTLQNDHEGDNLIDTAERLFRREAKVLLNVQHAGIPKLYAFFTAGDYRYLVQDFIPGTTLYDEVKKDGQIYTELAALNALEELADILEYLHGSNPSIIHRDIKPQNLMRHLDGRLMLIDFGAACQAVTDPEFNHTVVGSLGYAPPEQFLGQTVPQSDLYATAATILFLVTGIPPRLLICDKKSIYKELKDKLSPGFIKLLSEMLQNQVEDRLESATDLKNRVEKLKQELTKAPEAPALMPDWQHQPLPPPTSTIMMPKGSYSTPTRSAAPLPTIDIQEAAAFCYEVENTLRTIEFANHFAVLGVNKNSTETEIRKAFLERSEKFNPDRYRHLASFNLSISSDLAKIYKRITEAYSVLINRQSREDYSRSGRNSCHQVAKRNF